jgi:hypothetical protein
MLEYRLNALVILSLRRIQEKNRTSGFFTTFRMTKINLLKVWYFLEKISGMPLWPAGHFSKVVAMWGSLIIRSAMTEVG